MCGIVGIVHREQARPVDADLVRAMRQALVHRGPDGEGEWFRAAAGFGFRRLAIIDLSTGGQPMFNEDRSLAIVHNGEIYNYRELRTRLEALGHTFATASDTETIIHGYEQWGSGVLGELRGMFAFAIYDVPNHKLFLARDRFGKKPLFYSHLNRGKADEAFVFASELRAFLANPSFDRHIDVAALSDYMTYQFVPPPATILESVRSLEPAHWLMYGAGEVHIERYWNWTFEPKLEICEADAARRVVEMLDDATRARMVADVPVGLFLSAGLDSTSILAMMRRHVAGRLMTFSAKMPGERENELPLARKVAAHFQTDHHEIQIEPDPAECLPRLVSELGEPLAKISAVPFLYLNRFASGYVKVVLSGEGGDESFAGYPWYGEVLRSAGKQPGIWPKLVPGIARGRRDRKSHVSRRPEPQSPFEHLMRRQQMFHDAEKLELFDRAYHPIVASPAARTDRYFEEVVNNGAPLDLLDRMMYTDFMVHMRCKSLPTTDRLAMANGLEVRSPLLDQQLVQFAAHLPAKVKFNGKVTKSLIRRAMRPLLPKEVLEARKIGFGRPQHSWYREPLKPLAEEMLFDATARSRGFFNQQFLRQILDSHMRGAKRRHHLWSLLVFETWCRTFLD